MEFEPKSLVETIKKKPFYLLSTQEKLSIYFCMVDFCICYSSKIRYHIVDLQYNYNHF